MRIESVDVRGFGQLRDLVVAFHPRVTVILGDNEAGKSTVHRVIRAALYGLDAGGQGRAVERSDWARWVPWAGGPYGFAVTLVTDSGSRLRIAARLDKREQRVQVFEVGGGDVTADMRQGKLIVPGLHLLGIDEAVFCATAWLGEDGLRLGAPDAAAQRAQELQEAVERLADSGKNTTTTEAVGRLRDALERVGSERRSQSPLGVAAARQRQLEKEIEAARRRVEAYAADQAQLRYLEQAAELAQQRQRDSERAWLVGRLAALGSERLELQRVVAERAELMAVLDATASAADFPIEDEPRVLALAGEWHQAVSGSREVEVRWQAAAPTLERTQRRRAEILAGVEALGEPVVIDTTIERERKVIVADLETARAEVRRLGDAAGIESRAEALRREIAATGMGSIRVGSIEAVAPLITSAQSTAGSHLPSLLAGGLAILSLMAAAGMGAVHQIAAASATATAGLVVAFCIFLLARRGAGGSAQARRQLARMCPDLDVSDTGLVRAREQLSALTALHQDLLRQEVRAASWREELAAATTQLAAIAIRADRLASALDVVNTNDVAGDDPAAHAKAILDRIDAIAEAESRRVELLAEDAGLVQTEAALNLLADEARHTRAAVAAIEVRLRQRLRVAAESPDVEAAIAAFSEACAMRRRHDIAAAQLASLRPRLGEGDSDSHLAERAAQFSRDLLARGGDLAQVATAPPLDQMALGQLERDVEAARQQASAASLAAGELRSRLHAAFDGLPVLADIEDEYALCRAARDRANHQRAALNRAIELLTTSTRGVHRDMAPRLAASISARLCELSQGRYQSVNVDTDHFGIAIAGDNTPDLIPLDQMSHGTRDQVALLLRLALADVLSDSGELVPLFLDEPLLTADPHRRDMALDFLGELSKRHQVVLTTSDPALADDVRGRLGDAAGVVELVKRSSSRTDGGSGDGSSGTRAKQR